MREEIRATWTSSPSTTPTYKMPLYQYTGQASYMDDPTTSGTTEGFGLMFYNARWYDPYITQFSQPDSIVPTSTQGTQAWDRYAYSNNNPIKYTDPSGHVATQGDDGDYTYGDAAYNRQRLAHLNCAAGNNVEVNCSYGELHPVEVGLFGAGGLLLAGGGAALVGPPTIGEVIAAGEATTVIGTYCQGDCSDELNYMGETFYRFSERSGQFVNGLKPGEDSMSLYRVKDFNGPLDAFKAMAPNGDPPKAMYQITNYGTAVRNGFLPIYDKIPYGHVSLYQNVTQVSAWSLPVTPPSWSSIFWGPFPVLP